MANSNLGLGKGLSALIRETSGELKADEVHILPIKYIVPNPKQPRRAFPQETLEELAESIRKQGLLQPILVRKSKNDMPVNYEIIAGERRWRACQLAGLLQIPVVVRALTDEESQVAALVENLQREDLNPLEEALALQQLKKEYGLSQDELARQLGKSRPSVANSLRLLSLDEQTQRDVELGLLSPGHARALLSITEADAREDLRQRILADSLSVRASEAYASVWKETNQLSNLAVEEGQSTHFAQDELDTRPLAFPKKGKKPQSARLLEIQEQLDVIFQVPVKISGKENKGRISLHYASEVELEKLLAVLCLCAAEQCKQNGEDQG